MISENHKRSILFMAWQIDPSHSTVGFSVRHMVVSTVHGRFKVFDGSIEIDDANPANSSVEAHAETASIDTTDENRNNHLRSADFFDAEKYPTITFKSTKVEPTGDDTYQVTGDLTMHGVTKAVTFTVERSETIKDPYGNQRFGLEAKTKINRRDWGLSWGAVLEAGGAVVSDEVRLNLDLEAISK
jgi:polyisoprenoid-binding protein YceI